MSEIYRKQVADLFKDDIRFENCSFGEKIIFLGRGSFGNVYLRSHHELGDVAVKSLDVTVSMLSEQLLQDLSNEVNILKAATNHHIICLRGVIVEEGHHALVMEYARYGSLHVVQKKLKSNSEPRIPGYLLGRMMMETSSGLAYLHLEAQGKRPILHNDIKPENILVTEGFHAKIGDFGLSKIQSSLSSVSSNKAATYVRGTLQYVDLRLQNGDYIRSTKSDIYSLGISFLELAGGRKVFDDNDALEITKNNCRVKKEILLNYNIIPVQYPGFIVDVIKQCTSYDLDERQECSVIAEQLMKEVDKVVIKIREDEKKVYEAIADDYETLNRHAIDGSDTVDIADRPSTPSPMTDRGDGPPTTERSDVVSGELMDFVSKELGKDGIKLGRALGLPQAKLDHTFHLIDPEMTLEIINKWSQQSTAPTVGCLAYALEAIGRRDLKEKILGDCSDETSFVSMEQKQLISKEMGTNTRELGRKLGLMSADLENILVSESHHEKVYQTLKKWCQKSSSPTIQLICEALKNIGRTDLSQALGSKYPGGLSVYVDSPDMVLEYLSKQLGKSAKSLARELGVTAAELDEIFVNPANLRQEQSYQMMLQWSQQQGTSATVQIMEAALRNIGRLDISEKLDSLN